MMKLLCLLIVISLTQAFNHIEDLNAHLHQESRGFYKNLFSGEGIMDNINKIGKSFQVWKDILSDKRWANHRECGKDKSKNVLIQEPEVENEDVALSAEKQLRSIKHQIYKLGEYEAKLMNSSFSDDIIQANKENVRKHKKTLENSMQYHTARRYLQSTGVVAETYK